MLRVILNLLIPEVGCAFSMFVEGVILDSYLIR